MAPPRQPTRPKNKSHLRRERNLDEWVCKVGFAARHLDDRIVLNQTPLARLAYIEKLARERHRERTHPRGLALRETIVACIDDIVEDLKDEPALSRVTQYLVLLKEGVRCKEISSRLGLSREHVSRLYRRIALQLLTEAFLKRLRIP